MRAAPFVLCVALLAPAAASGQPAGRMREVRFTGPSAVDALCSSLLDARRQAEAQGQHRPYLARDERTPPRRDEEHPHEWQGEEHKRRGEAQH